MSNDLVKRLRRWAKLQDYYAPYDCENDSAELTEAADCIEELLEALLEARAYVPDHHGPIAHKIDAAIAKAKGEAG